MQQRKAVEVTSFMSVRSSTDVHEVSSVVVSMVDRIDADVSSVGSKKLDDGAARTLGVLGLKDCRKINSVPK